VEGHIDFSTDKNTTQKTKNMSNVDSTNKTGVNPGAGKI
jgi:hypothetical protein